MGAPIHLSTDVLVLNARALATVYDRQQVTVEYGTIGDQFQRNVVSTSAEERLAFAVARPAAAVSVTALN
jgi:hypothetical protein